jgi:hypothetical protein
MIVRIMIDLLTYYLTLTCTHNIEQVEFAFIVHMSMSCTMMIRFEFDMHANKEQML